MKIKLVILVPAIGLMSCSDEPKSPETGGVSDFFSNFTASTDVDPDNPGSACINPIVVKAIGPLIEESLPIYQGTSESEQIKRSYMRQMASTITVLPAEAAALEFDPATKRVVCRAPVYLNMENLPEESLFVSHKRSLVYTVQPNADRSDLLIGFPFARDDRQWLVENAIAASNASPEYIAAVQKWDATRKAEEEEINRAQDEKRLAYEAEFNAERAAREATEAAEIERKNKVYAVEKRRKYDECMANTRGPIREDQETLRRFCGGEY